MLKGKGFNRVVIFKLLMTIAHSKKCIVYRYACTHTLYTNTHTHFSPHVLPETEGSYDNIYTLTKP